MVRHLRPVLDQEMKASGFTAIGMTGLGSFVLFSKSPVRDILELRRGRYWIWDLDKLQERQLRAMGVKVVPLPLDEAARAYDDGRVDGFISPPAIALAFSWSPRTRFFTDLRTPFLMGCVVVTSAAFERLSFAHQQLVRAAGTKLMARIEEVGAQQDAELVNGLFERQGVKPVPVSESFRNELTDAARRARDSLGDSLVPRALVERVLALLADRRLDNKK